MQSWDFESDSEIEGNAGDWSDYHSSVLTMAADLLDTINPDSDDDDEIEDMLPFGLPLVADAAAGWPVAERQPPPPPGNPPPRSATSASPLGPFVGQMLDPPPPPGNPLLTPNGLVVLSDAELVSQKSRFQAVLRLLGGGVYNTPLFGFVEYVLNFGLLGAIDTPGGLVDCSEMEFMFGANALEGIVDHAYPYYLANVRRTGKGAWVLSSAGVNIYYGWFAAPEGMRQNDASSSIDTACPPTWYPSIIISLPDGTIQIICLKMLYLLCRHWTVHHNRVVVVAQIVARL